MEREEFRGFAMEVEFSTQGDSHEYLVWDDNLSKVIATARLKERNRRVEIAVVNVDRGYRGEGIGSMLLNKIISDFSEMELIAWVFRERVSWYERNGFKARREKGCLVEVVAE
jgi:N-acetylglutamate synthase-like GNAT family acetyltransferase